MIAVQGNPLIFDLQGVHHSVTFIVSNSTKLLIPTMDNYLGQFARLTGTYDIKEKEFLEHLVSDGQTIIEIGTNFGPYSTHLAHKIGSEGLLLCFEPFKIPYQLLTANIAINGLSNVVTENLGIGDGPRRIIELDAPDFTFSDNYGAASLVDHHRKTWLFSKARRENITIIPLDSYKIERHINLIKIDAEGMEFEIIRGASNLLKTHSPLLYVENDPQTRFSGQTFEVMMQENFGYACSRPNDLTRHNIILCYFNR